MMVVSVAGQGSVVVESEPTDVDEDGNSGR